MYQHIAAALPADAAARLAASTGESPGRAAALLASALPLLAAALPGATADGLDALLAGETRGLLRRLFGTDVDAMARSLAGATRSTRASGLAALETALLAVVAGVSAALAGHAYDRPALIAIATGGRAEALAQCPPQLGVVISNFPGLAARITPPRPVRTKQDKASGNWMLALVRRMRPK
jgi:hypothetical protein